MHCYGIRSERDAVSFPKRRIQKHRLETLDAIFDRDVSGTGHPARFPAPDSPQGPQESQYIIRCESDGEDLRFWLIENNAFGRGNDANIAETPRNVFLHRPAVVFKEALHHQIRRL